MGGKRFRFDTRIYLEPKDAPDSQDPVLGCIIGKNPGSAMPGKRSSALTPIILSGDKFLPTVLSIVRQSYALTAIAPPRNSYVQVLNLFYLCDRDLAQAKRSLSSVKRPPICPSEQQQFPWAWFAWGGADPVLDPLKPRFEQLQSNRDFYYSRDLKRVIAERPDSQELAKHTQGMPQSQVVDHLAKLIAR